MEYFAHRAFYAPAQAKSELWRLVLGVVVIALLFALGLGGLVAVLAFSVEADAFPSWLEELSAPETPLGTLMVFSTFVAMMLATWLGTLAVHRRGFGSLVGQNGQVVAEFLRAFGIAFVVLIFSLAWFFWTTPVLPNLAFDMWLMFLPVALIAIFIQTGAEELLFRGYLQQQLAARFGSVWIWMIVPAILFGLAHFDMGNMGNSAFLMLGAATLFGLLAADLTAKTGSIASAWGFHFANNCLALLAVAVPGSISGLSLFLTPFRFEETDVLLPMIAQDMAVTVVIWALIRLVASSRQRAQLKSN